MADDNYVVLAVASTML